MNLNQMKNIDKKYPEAIEFEKMILGAILIESDLHDEIIPKLSPKYFYNSQNEIIFREIQLMYLGDIAIDIKTVAEKCKKHKIDPFLISGLTQNIVSGANTETHILFIKQKYIERQLIKMSVKIQANSYDLSIDLIESLDLMQKIQSEVDEIIAGESQITEFPMLLKESIKQAEKRFELAKKGEMSGIKTGFIDLDKKTNGWYPGELIIIAGRPAMGKTSLMLKFSKKAAEEGKKIRIYSLEMTAIGLTDRILLSECGFDADKFRSGDLSEDHFIEMKKSANKLEKLGINIDDKSSRTIYDIGSNAKMWQRKKLCDMIIIDYLQLIKSQEKTKREQIVDITGKAKILARELNIPVILVSQLSRAVELRGGSNEPQMSDLKESGSIEEDADKIIFIYRPEYYGFEDFKFNNESINSKGLGILNLAKQRNGMTGKMLFKYNESLTKFFDYDYKEQQDDLPF